ncbi:hypothetical protein L603_000100001350 [Cellulosimicrobium cellulans J34]|jgi:hypothetical protein|nr:hypothetical protein L603_000100001350 [Cellulosimicrobium cellulans J34]SME96203.1 hypothetical protein SAMN02744115_00573 [Cellulosimicrobium cellulans J1]
MTGREARTASTNTDILTDTAGALPGTAKRGQQ